jgi:hypothetical protein
MTNGPRETLTIDAASAEAAAASIPFARSGRAGILARIAPWVLGAARGDGHGDGDVVAVSAASVPWTSEGRTYLTVVVKLAFAIQRGAEARLVAASEAPAVHVRDRHHKNQPLGRVIAPSDRAPYRPHVDVTLVGTAHAKAGELTPRMPVRLALTQRGVLAIDKTLLVVGKRATDEASPEPFASMPIGFDRAYGGPATLANPIGTGDDPDDDERPCVLDPRELRRPAGFGPLGASWPVRAKQLAGTPRKQVEAIVPDLPRTFEWSYYQHAPADQRIASLDPDATVILEGFDPDFPTLSFELPGPRVVGAIYGLDPADADAGVALDFQADMLHLDVDAWTCELAYRASFPIGDGVDLGGLFVAVGAGTAGRAPPLAARRPEMEEPSSNAEVSSPRPGGRRAATVLWEEAAKAGTLSVRGDELPSHKGTLPFGAAHAPSAPAAPSVASSPSVTSSTEALPPVELGSVDLDAPVPSSPWAREAARGRGRVIAEKAKASAWATPAAVAAPPIAPPIAPPVTPMTPTPRPAQEPHEVVGLELFAAMSAALDEPRPDVAAILEHYAVADRTLRAAARFWRDAMRRELRIGQHELRDRHDDAYVAAWEAEHPGLFASDDFARLDEAERGGTFLVVAEEMGLEPALATRLRRVWRRRLAATTALRREAS